MSSHTTLPSNILRTPIIFLSSNPLLRDHHCAPMMIATSRSKFKSRPVVWRPRSTCMSRRVHFLSGRAIHRHHRFCAMQRKQCISKINQLQLTFHGINLSREYINGGIVSYPEEARFLLSPPQLRLSSFLLSQQRHTYSHATN